MNYTINLSRYAGQTDYVYFGCYGDGYSQTYTYQYVDDVTWVGRRRHRRRPPNGETDGNADRSPTPTPTSRSDPDTDHSSDVDADQVDADAGRRL